MSAVIEQLAVRIDGDTVVISVVLDNGTAADLDHTPVDTRILAGALADAAETAGRQRLRAAA